MTSGALTLTVTQTTEYAFWLTIKRPIQTSADGAGVSAASTSGATGATAGGEEDAEALRAVRGDAETCASNQRLCMRHLCLCL